MSKTLATKYVATVLVAFALILGFSLAFAQPAKADQLSDLQAQVNALLAQIASMQGSSSSSGSTMTGSGCHTFTMNEKVGSSGGEVMWVQQFLNGHGFMVAATGAGSPGNETSHFGPATKAAVIKFQDANAASILTPVGLTKGTGNWGASSRAQANAMCTSSTTGGTTGGTTTGGTTTGGTTTGGGVSVMAGTQPTNSLAPQGASRVPFTTFTLQNTSNASVTITGVQVQRTGFANDAAFSGVVLVDANGMQVGVSRTFDANHQATVGDTFTIGAGQSMTFTVAGNMAASLSSYTGQVAAVDVIGINTTVPVSGSLPIHGASQTLNSTLSIGTVTANTSSYDVNAAQTKNIGDTGLKFTAVRLTAGSAEDVKLFSIRWRMNGSAAATDMTNIVTVVNGTSYPATLSTDGRYYTSTFPGGILIKEGFSADAYIQGDLVGSNSAARVAEFDLDKTSDVYLVGQTYGYGILVTLSGSCTTLSTASTHATCLSTSGAALQPWLQGSTFSINAGTVSTISNATEVAAQNIAVSVPSQPLGGFATNFLGEPVSVQTLVFDVATTSSACTSSCLLTNVSLVDSNGAVVAGPVNATQGTSKQVLTFSNTVTFPIGRHVYTLKGTVGSGEPNGETYVVSTTPSSSSYWANITGQSSGNTVSLAGIGSFNMNTMTVKGAALSIALSTTPSAQTIVAGGQSVLFANVQLDASQSGEDVRVNSLKLYVHQRDVATGGTVSGLSACQLIDSTGNTLNYGSNIINAFTNEATTTAGTHPQTFSLNNSLNVPKGTVVTLAAKCDVSSSATAADAYTVSMYSGDTIAFTGANSGTSANATITTSSAGVQTIASAGSVAVVTDPSSPSYAIGAAGTTGVIAGVGQFRPSNEAVNLTKIGLTLTNGSYTGASGAQDLTTAYLYNGSTLIGTATFTGNATTATSTLLSQVNLPKDVNTKITVKVDLADISASAPGTEGDLVKVDVVNFEGSGASSGQTVRGGTTGGLTGVAGIRLLNTFPTVAQGTLPSTSLAAGRLIRFAVTANSAGDVGIARFTLTVATSSGVTISSLGLYGYSDSGYSTPISGQGTSGLIGSTVTATSTSNIPFSIISSNTPVEVPAGQTYYFELRGTVAGYVTGSSITTTLLGDSSFNGMVSTSSATGAFVWSPNATTTSTGPSNDWTNGYGVIGLPSGGLTQGVTQ